MLDLPYIHTKELRKDLVDNLIKEFIVNECKAIQKT